MSDAPRQAARVKPGSVNTPPRRTPKPADPCTMVIFGGGGDLTSRLLMPALYNLAHTKLLPENFALIGIGISERTTEQWRDDLYKSIKEAVGSSKGEFHLDKIDEGAWKQLGERMTYLQGDLNDDKLYKELGDLLAKTDKQHKTAGNAIFYLAIADRFFGTVVDKLGAAKLTQQSGQDDKKSFWRRVVIEKPFGHSVESARALDADIGRTLKENQIFRIDHFLGKETVQSIMALRFANGLFEPLWNRDRIDHVQITASETVGVEARGKFYEATGALRDMIPNHVFSLLSLVAMEPPTSFEGDSVRNKKAEVLTTMRTATPEKAVRGQYAAGEVGGKKKAAYRDEPDVDKKSTTETYVAMELEVDNWRWAGVPFYIRTGKHMSFRRTEIAIRFKQAPFAPFTDTPMDSLPPNWLVLSVAPDEGISLQFEVKRPGPVMDLAAVKMDFHASDWFEKEPNVGYETLLYDVMIGDQTLFMRADMVEQAWRVVQPVLDAWGKDGKSLELYKSGSDGPEAADDLLGERSWRPVTPPPAENGKSKK